MRHCSEVITTAVLLVFVHLFSVSSISALSSERGQLESEKTADAQAAETYFDQSAANLEVIQNDQGVDRLAIQPHGFGEESALSITQIDSRQSSPDDIFWDNGISPSYPGADGTVYAVTVFRGHLIVAGDFTLIDNTPINGIASWDGSSWAPLGDGDGPSRIHCLSVFNDRLIAGGNQSVSAWDGDSWSSLGIGIPNYTYVDALTTYDNKLIISGSFNSAGGIPAHMIIAWDGANWSQLRTGLGPGISSNFVGTLAVFDDKLVVGGRFSTADGRPAHNIAVWDGLSWSSLGTGTNDDVFALITYDGKLVAAGRFDSCGGVAANSIACWDGTSWSALGSGINSDWYGPVMSLGVFDGRLVAGGYFNRAGGAVADFLTAWDGDSWSILKSEPNGIVRAMTGYDGKLIIGGMFTAIGEARPARISSWDGNSWGTLISAEPGFDGITRALEVFDHKLYAGGDFTTAGGAPTDHIACWDGSSWSPVDAGLNGTVTKMLVNDDKLAVGGDFTMAGDATAQHVATWDGGNWAPLGSGMPYPVVAMTKYNNAITVAHQFDYEACIDFPAVHVSIRSWDGSAWPEITSFRDCGVNVKDLVAFDDKLLMFTRSGWSYAILSWDGASWSYISYYYGVHGGTVVMNGKLLVGKQTAAGPWSPSVSWVDSWDGSTWSDMEWNIDGLARAFAFYDRKLIVGGSFSSIGGISARNIAAWDGETWSALGSGTNGPIDGLETYNGTLIVAGRFTMAGDKISPFMAVWTKHDTLEVALDVKPGSCSNPINGNSAHGQGKAILPVAIMGTADFDVHDIDLATVTLNGTSPVRWHYEDVGAPPDDPDEDCACSEAGPDGYTDLNLKFYSAEVVTSLGNDSVVRVDGQLYDGTSFEGRDCVTPVGRSATRAITADDQERGFAVSGNAPNPFNPITRISFYLPDAVHVKLEIFNVLGQLVSTLIDQSLEAGDHSVTWNGSQAASGIYYYRLQAGDNIVTDKMLLLK